MHAVLCTAFARHDQVHLHHCSLPADVAADDDVAAEDGTLGHGLVDGVGDDTGGHGELDRARVDDANHVAGSGGLEDAEEWPVAAVLSVKLDDLLVVVGALEQLDARVERAAVSVEVDLRTEVNDSKYH